MTSHSVLYRKISVSSAQRFAYICELVDTYCASVQVVQHYLTHIYKSLNRRKILSPDQCISLLNAFSDMRKALSSLCSTFKELANLPDTLVSFHVEVFMDLSNIQNQAKQLEVEVKRYYQYVISSKSQNITELTPTILQLIKIFRANLSKVDILLKNVMGQTDHQSRDIPSVSLNKEDGCVQTPASPLAVVSEPPSNEQIDIVHQEASANVAPAALISYKIALNQRLEQLSQVEIQKAAFFDPRNISSDLREQENLIRQEIKHLLSEIGILEQTGKNEVS